MDVDQSIVFHSCIHSVALVMSSEAEFHSQCNKL